jgi:hypothetical protein
MKSICECDATSNSMDKSACRITTTFTSYDEEDYHFEGVVD